MRGFVKSFERSLWMKGFFNLCTSVINCFLFGTCSSEDWKPARAKNDLMNSILVLSGDDFLGAIGTKQIRRVLSQRWAARLHATKYGANAEHILMLFCGEAVPLASREVDGSPVGAENKPKWCFLSIP